MICNAGVISKIIQTLAWNKIIDKILDYCNMFLDFEKLIQKDGK